MDLSFRNLSNHLLRQDANGKMPLPHLVARNASSLFGGELNPGGPPTGVNPVPTGAVTPPASFINMP